MPSGSTSAKRRCPGNVAKITVVFVLTYVGFLATALLVDAAWAFYLYQLVYFLNPPNRWWGGALPDISYSFVTVVVLAVSMIIQRGRSVPYNRLFDVPVTKWLLGILLMYAGMYFVALSPDRHLQALIEFTKLLFIVALAYKVLNSERKLDFALWAYVIGATYIGYVATGIGRSRGLRLEGIGTIDSPDSNGTAALLGPALILLIYFAWFGNKYVKFVAAICGAVIANGIVLLNSRGSFLAILAGAVVMISYMLFSRYQMAGQRVMAILLIVAGLGGTVAVTDDAFWERMGTLREVTAEESDSRDRGGAHRVEFWLATFDIMQDYPLGVGVRGYNLVSSRYIDPSLTDGGKARKSVHSSWFQVLAEIGWPGPLLVLAMLISCFRLSARTKRYLIERQQYERYYKVVALETALIVFLISATFINRIRAELLYWLIMFLCCGANILYLRARQELESSRGVKALVVDSERRETAN